MNLTSLKCEKDMHDEDETEEMMKQKQYKTTTSKQELRRKLQTWIALFVWDIFVFCTIKVTTTYSNFTSLHFIHLRMHILKAKKAQTRTSVVSHVCQKVVP